MGFRGHIGKILQSFAVAALCLVLPGRLQAATSVNLTDSTGTGTFNLSTPSTWTATPTNGDNVFLVLTSSGNGGSKNNATYTNAPSNVFVADSLSITNTAGGNKHDSVLSVTFSGMAFFTSGVAQVNFAGGTTAQAANTLLTFNSNVTFGAMNFAGTNNLSGNTATLTLAGTSQGNSLLFDGGGSGNNFLIVSGNLGLTGTLTATNINANSAGTISGNSTVSRVVLNNTTDGAFTIASSTMNVTGATASVAGGFTIASGGTLSLSGTGGLIISNVAPLINGTLNIGNQTVNGKTNWTNDGTVSLAGGFIVGNNLTNNSDGILVGSGSLSNVVVNLGTIWTTNSTLSFASNIVQGGTLTIGGGSTISLLGSGALTNFGTINLVGAAGAGNNAVLNLGSVAITNKSGGTITGGGIIQNSAQVVNLSGGSILATSTVVELQFTNASTFGNAGTIGAAAGATLTFGTAGVGSAIITNFGTINLTGGTLLSGNITNLATGFLGGNGNVSGPVVNSGTVNANNGELQLSGTASGAGTYRAVAGGTLTFAGGGSISALYNTNATIKLESILTNNSLFVNQGTIVLNAGAYQSTANLTNAAGEFIIASDDSTINAAGVFNRGTILTTNAILIISNLFAQSGTVTIGNGGSLVLGGSVALTNSGTINLVGAAGAGNNAILNLGSVALTNLSGGTITGGGIIQNSSQVVNLSGGSILATSTVVELQFTNANTVGNAGTIGAATGATLTFGTAGTGSAIITNFGTINLTGGTLRSGDISNLAGGFLGGTGTITAQVINQGRVNLGATIASNFLQSAGSFTVNGSGTITGTTTINGGTLDLNGGLLTNGLLVIGTGGTLTNGVQNATLNGGITNAGLVNLFRDTYINGPLTNTGTWIQRGAISNNVVNSGTMTLLTNSINLRVTGSIVNSGSLTFDTNGVIYVSGVVSNSGSFSFGDVISNNLVNTAGTITLNGAGTVTGTTTINGGTLNLNGKSLTNALLLVNGTGVVTNSVAGATVNGGVSNANVMAFTANTFFNGPVTNTGALFLQGTISNSLANSGTIILNGDSVVTGRAVINGGSLNLNGMDISGGQVVVGVGGLLTNGVAGGSVSSGLTNGGTVFVSQATFFNGVVTNTGAFSWLGAISNNYVQTAGTNTLIGSATITQNATVDGGLFNLNGQTYSNNLMIVDGGAGVLSNGVAGATFNGGLSNAATVVVTANTFFNGIVTNVGAFFFQGAVSNNFVNSGNGTVTLNNTATITKTAMINGGTFNLNGQTISNGLMIVDGGTGVLTNGVAGATVNGGLSNSAIVAVTADTFFNGPVTNVGGFFFQGAISNNFVNSGNGTVTLNNTATITKTATINGGTFNLNGQTISNGLMIVDGGNGVLTNAVAGATVNGGVSNSATVAVTANTFFNGPVTNVGGFFFQGAISNNFVNSGSGTVTLNNTATITKTAMINGGTFNLNGQTISNGLMIVDGGNGVLTNAVAGATVNGGVSNSATVAVTANTFFNGPVTNMGVFFFEGAISNALVNNGSFNLNNNATLTAAPVNDGTINVGSSTLTVIPDWANAGSIQISGGVLAGGNVTNNSGEGFLGSGTISNLVINNGTLTASGGTLTLVQAPINNGTAIVASASVLNVLPAWINSGLLSNAPTGTVDGGTLTNAGTINGLGFFNEQVVNQNRMNFGGTISNGVLQTAGSFTVNGTGTITGTTTINGGTLDLAGGRLTNGLLVIAGTGLLTNSVQNATLNGGITNAATVNFATDVYVNGPVTNTGTWIQRGAISNNVVNSGTMFILSNSIAARITGSVVNSGSLTFSNSFVSGVVSNSGSFLFSGAISNNYVQTAGSLALNNTATITGTASINSGTLDLNGKRLTNGLLVVSGTGVVTNSVAGATVNGGVSNANVMGFTANTFFNGPVTNTGTFAFMGAVSNTLANSGNVILNNSGTVSTLVNNGSVNVNNGTLSLLAAPVQNGSITVANGATVNAAQAWVNNGTITLLGGSITNAAITNNLFISGFGTIDGGGVVNNGKLFADASSISGVGTETVRIANFTNNVNATIGTASSNAVLNLLTTGNTLINRGTVSLSGGTILFNGGTGTITNFNIIAGVGNVANFPIVNAGTLASFVAQAPISGLSNLIATVGVTNNGLLGANNFINGAATLSLTVNGGGAAIVNHGTVALQGGFLTINGGGGTITNIANGLIYGVGTQELQVANLAGGTIMASNGVFSLGLQSNANAGVLSNRNAASTILLTNKFLVNNGTVVLNGGGLILSGSVITNEGLILGPGAFSSSVYNDTTGLISVTNGVLNVATNLGETVSNLGLITISSDGTLNVVPDWLNTNGTVSILGGDLTGGVVTNIGTVSGFGTISSQVVNQGGGTLTATGAGSLTLVDAPTQGGWVNIGNGATLNVLQSWLNSGTVNMQGGTLVGSTITNAGSITGFGTITPLVRNNGGATFTVTGGTMTLAIAPTQIGTFVVTNGGTLNVLAAWQNSGTVSMVGGDIIGSTVTNAGTMTGFGGVQNLVNNGGIFVTNGTLRATASFTQNSTVDIAANSRLDVTPTWSNNGSVLINGGFVSGGTMNNTASGLVRGFGTISNAVANLGTIVATNGTLSLVNALSQSGTITVANAATFTMARAWQNNGSVSILGGTLAGATVTNAATISGSGVISAALSNTGYLRATNGQLSVQTLAGNQAAGILEASAGATLAVNGTTSWLNNGQLTLTGGTVIGGDISNNASHLITGAGTINVNVYNNGSIVADNGSQVLTLNNSLVNLAGGVVAANTGNLVVNGTFTNAGTLNMIHSVGTFSGAVVNSGAWVTDPTINVFQNTYTVTSSGYIQSSPGDVYIFSNNATTASSFINLSTNKNQFNTLGGDFVFANTLGATQQFAVAGHDFGPGATSSTNTVPTTVNPLTLSMYSNNFALGTLQISDSTTVEVTDAFSLLGPGTNDGLEAALYLDNLYMGSNSLLLIAGNVQLYFVNSNNWDMANIELEGNPGLDNSINGIHQFAVIPEPSVILLWLCGFATIHAARRRWKTAGRNFQS